MTRRPLTALAATTLVAAVSLGACSTDSAAGGASAPAATSASVASRPPDDLSTYTDAGDGCQQLVSAIGYADESLVPLGNEDYQDFDLFTRGKIAAIAGTVATEEEDFPDAAVREQARALVPLASAAAALEASPGRVRALRELRREAAQLVLLCADQIRPSPSPSSTSSATP